MKITALNREEFYTKGWTLVNTGFSKNEIKDYLNATISLKQKAFSSNFPLQRCYYPHLFHKNIAAIESPFNRLIVNSGVEELFQRLELGNSLNKLLGWKKCYLHLARLFTMDKYKYRGNWHRDFENWDGRINNIEKIQVAIYLKNQDGFRIFKYSHDMSSKTINSISYDPTSSPYLPAKIDQKYFDEIEGKAGTVLFFAPGIIHQGNSQVQRLDYHLRFSNLPLCINNCKIKYRLIDDYYLPEFYQKNFDTNKDFFSARIRDVGIKEKFANTLNYYTGIINLIKSGFYLLNRTKKIQSYPYPWRYDLRSNTIFQ